MRYRALIDTNVWLDFYLGNRPGHFAAKTLLVDGAREGLAPLVAATSLKDVFFIFQQENKRMSREQFGELSESQSLAASAAAWAIVEHMLEFATVVGVDHGDAYVATKYKSVHGDFEDDLVIAAAQRADVDFLVTNDLRLQKHSSVQAFTPIEAIAYLGLDLREEVRRSTRNTPPGHLV